MRCAMISAALVFLGTTALAGEEKADPVRELKGISAQMHRAKERLEAEHHGVRVLLTQREVLKRLDELIRKVEEAQQPPHDGKPDPNRKPKPTGGPKPPSGGPLNEDTAGQNPTRPLDREFMTRGAKPPAGMRKTRAELSAIGGKWGILSPKMRRRIIQVRSAQLPARCRRMIVIYLMAIAEEDGR